MTSKLKIVLVEKMNSFPTSDTDDSASPAKIYLLGANKDTSGPLIPLNEAVQFMKERAVPRKTSHLPGGRAMSICYPQLAREGRKGIWNSSYLNPVREDLLLE